MQSKSHAELGLLALVVLTAVYGLTAVMARFFSDQVGIFEQWYIRFLLATIMTALVFRRKIRFKHLPRVSRREKLLVVLRGLLGFVFAAGLYAWASQHAKIGSVAAMQVVPTTALLGMVLLHEKVSSKKALLIGLSFFGALTIVLRSPTDLLELGLGEIASLVSGALFSLTFVLRKKHTGELNNYELALTTLAVGTLGSYLASIFVSGRLLPSQEILTPKLGLLFIIAAALSVLMSLLSSYGFEHVKATTASVILDLELVFGVAFGYLFYREVLSAREGASCVIIIAAVIAMNRLDSKQNKLTGVPLPH